MTLYPLSDALKGGYSSFRRGPKLWEIGKLARLPHFDDNCWSDASLSLSNSSQSTDGPSLAHKQQIQYSNGPSLAHHQQQPTSNRFINLKYDVFPPPLDSPTRCSPNFCFPDSLPTVHMEAIRENGRLVLRGRLQAEPQRYWRAKRENGRLKLQLVEAKPSLTQEEEGQEEAREDRARDGYSAENLSEEAEKEALKEAEVGLQPTKLAVAGRNMEMEDWNEEDVHHLSPKSSILLIASFWQRNFAAPLGHRKRKLRQGIMECIDFIPRFFKDLYSNPLPDASSLTCKADFPM